ncbi:hypothetical protein OG455_19665 [Kitasatospora sp. NBC_01287]|uniref:hypothetical protein n=1 Tax=Kitasatospora sp. NBC_01287 TaxID=2903573 RepID=UPI00225123FF|nr:hypothetical protein [Kitasatospora sp. NBC_01287]MCX4747704.1 hypothetical protein [Kitasatospora sp. NBC_01287]
MKLARTAAVGVAALGLASLQLALGVAAQADDFGSLTLQQWAPEPGNRPVVIAPGAAPETSIWVGGKGAAPIEANVLVTVRSVLGQDPALPQGVSLTFPSGTCAPAVPGTAPAQAAAFICDMAKPTPSGAALPGNVVGSSATVTVNTTAATADRTAFVLTQTLVPHGDTTLAQVQADQQGGQKFQTGDQAYEVESKERAAQGGSTFQLADFTAGQTAVQTVKVHAADHPEVVVRAEDGTSGQSWNPSQKEELDLPPGLDLLSATADNGASCRTLPVGDQHSPTVEDTWLMDCLLSPGDTTLKLTFKADPALKTTMVKLDSRYGVYSDAEPFSRPFSDSSGTFTVNAAPAAAPSTSAAAPTQAAAAPSAPASTAPAATATAKPAAVISAKPSAATSRGAASGELAFTGANGTVTYAVGGAVVLAAGVGILAATRRRAARH